MNTKNLVPDLDPLAIPFRVKTSFKAIYRYWEDQAKSENAETSAFARNLLERMGQYPVLASKVEDYTVFETYEEQIHDLFAPLFPEPLQSNEIKAIMAPFSGFLMNPTKRFRKILDNAGADYKWQVENFAPDDFYRMACITILNTIYKANVDIKKTLYFNIPNIQTGVSRKYRAFFNADFSVFKTNEKTIPLTDDDVRLLIENYNDIDLWKTKIPPGSYDLEGFALVSLFDVTEEEALSSMKNSLLQKDALSSNTVRDEISKQMQAYLNISDAEVGFAMFDGDTRKIRLMGEEDWSCMTLTSEGVLDSTECFCDVSYEEIFDRHEMFVVSDVNRFGKGVSTLIDRVRSWGVQSFIVAPLAYDNRVLGFLEVGSEIPGVMNTMEASKLNSILPMFTVAMQRALEERETQLESIVQEKFTALHPSVSWRFQQVAENALSHRQQGQPDPPDEVIFRDVVPIYGQFDIRGSSNARNTSIQKDLVKQLTLAENVMDAARLHHKLPIYDHLRFRIQKYRRELENGIMAGDEIKILDFLNSEIYPVFNHLSDLDENLQQTVAGYMSSLDEDLSVVYEERKRYETSVTKINEFVSNIIETEQAKAQQMFPHYFEKYKTDGVEYNMYIGQSLQPSRKYDSVYLRNLRLWQLLLTAHIEAQVNSLQDSLPMPLKITSLILAHNSPLSIKFRQDEKKFDVDGAYNIRYEIMKKRIDKAHIKNSNERLTQPGHIAVVFSQDEEAEEYLQYIEYLQVLGIVGEKVESLELEDLQGTSGLRALRVDVKYSDTSSEHLARLYEASAS